MRKRLETQLEFDFMKDVKIKKRVDPLTQKLVLFNIGLYGGSGIMAGAYIYKDIPQLFESIKNYIGNIF